MSVTNPLSCRFKWICAPAIPFLCGFLFHYVFMLTGQQSLATSASKCMALSPADNATTAAIAFHDGTGEKKINIPHSDRPIQRIILLGERNSGTNYLAKSLLSSAFQKYGEGNDKDRFGAQNIPVFEFKHMFFQNGQLPNATQLQQLAEHDEILWLLQLRSPCEWAKTMKTKPWHLCPLEKNNTVCKPLWYAPSEITNTLSMAEFMQIPLIDYGASSVSIRKLNPNLRWRFATVDDLRRNFPTDAAMSTQYRNIWELRSHKQRIMQQLRRFAPRVKLAYIREWEAAPNRFVHELQQEFGLAIEPSHRPLPPSDILHYQPCFGLKDVQIMEQEIDWKLEAEFGFYPQDCHTCASYKST